MTARPLLTPTQLNRERSILWALWLDAFTIALVLGAAIAAQSLTMLALTSRAMLMMIIEIVSLLVMRRIHRGQFAELDFGVGKFEQMVSLTIAAGMVIGAIWITIEAIGMLLGDIQVGTPTSLAASAIVAGVNAYANFVAWAKVKAATPPMGAPVIMKAQLRSRWVKFLTSMVVVCLQSISARFNDPSIVEGCDIIGSLFVAAFIFMNAIEMIRGGLPELMDKSVDEAIQRSINRALAAHFDDYSRLDRVRSRCSGGKVFIEVGLGFDADLTVNEVNQRIDALNASIQAEVKQADVSIVMT